METKSAVELIIEKFDHPSFSYLENKDAGELASLLQEVLKEGRIDEVKPFHWQEMSRLGYFSSEELAIARGNEYHRTWTTKEECRDYLRSFVILFEKFQEKDGIFIHTNHCNGTTEFRIKQYGEDDFGIEDENGRRIFVEYRGNMICLLPDYMRNDELWKNIN